MNMIALDRAVGIVIDTCDPRAKWTVGFEGRGPQAKLGGVGGPSFGGPSPKPRND